MDFEKLERQVAAFHASKQYAGIRGILVELNPADIAVLLERFEPEDRALFFRLLPKEEAAEAFVQFGSDSQEAVIKSFSDAELREVFDELFLDDAVDIIEEMPASVVKRILRNTDPQTRGAINALLEYPEDSAGSIMTTEFVDLKRDLTVEDAFKRIRRTGVDKETIYTCYITDASRHLIGVTTVRELLLHDYDDEIAGFMETNVISVRTHDDQETAVRLLDKYDFLAIPVVDKEDRLVGIITVDDAIDVLQEENTEDIQKMNAILPSEKPYLKTGVWETWRSRIPWLMLLMVSATFTGMIITAFEAKLAALIILTSFIPMLMDTGGNSGGQASVTIIRALSLGEIQPGDVARVVWKEVRVGLVCGASLSAVCFAKTMLVDRLLLGAEDVTLTVAVVISLTLLVEVVFAKVVGCSFPILAKKLGFDPAVMSSPFITTIVDALSLLIYFGLAAALLHI